MAMLVVRAPIYGAKLSSSFLRTSPPNSSSCCSKLRNVTPCAQFPPRPLIFGEEPGGAIQCVQLDDVASGAGGEAGSSDVSEANADITTCLQLYKEALENNDETKLAEIEALFKSVKDAKDDLEKKVVSLSRELTVERIRVLRIGADFDNFRKNTETERLSLVTNVRGEVVGNLLPVLDKFERAKARIKAATEGEEKINNSYQSIHKQFAEILASVDVVPVETVGNNPFDSMVQNRVSFNPIDQLFGKMLRLLDRSFFSIYVVGAMSVSFAVLTLCAG